MSDLRVLFSADDIRGRVNEVAEAIASDYQEKELVLVGMLKGAAFFLADLARCLPRPVDYEFVSVSSSIGAHGEVVSLTFATQVEVTDRHVLVLKDVFHSGITENYLITHLSPAESGDDRGCGSGRQTPASKRQSQRQVRGL